MRIVSSLPHKGPLLGQSTLVSQAIDLAIEQHGTTSGRWKYEHLALDGGDEESGEWSRAREEANARRAAEDVSVVAYVGPYNSGAAAVSLPVTNRAGLLQTGPTATWPGLTLPGWDSGEPEKYYPTGRRTFLRMMPPDSVQGAAAAQWASRLDASSVYVLSDGSSYSAGLATQFAASAQAAGLRIAGTGEVAPPRWESLPRMIAESGADALFYAPSTPANAAAAAQTLQDGRLSVRVLASDVALSDQFLEIAGPAAEDWYIVHNGVAAPKGAEWSRFAADFSGKYGRPPSQYAGNAYDATNLVLDAVEKGAGRDRNSVIDALLATSNYQGVTGPISFDEHGDRIGWQLNGYRLVGDKFVLERLLSSEE